ncbi:cellulase-like family protein [Halomonas elongata]|uniref:cellulase-like family protein n=1 Tax=Halomonas elongata TaxID=2746 RepID=UPI00255AB957|nr:cellulase-like family protein [Halomonas elongata]MDL4861087.1 cellulase-like family protein [Halomonas elongata]WVI71180.1 cellulase-like family protein [Halomonas elongata]
MLKSKLTHPLAIAMWDFSWLERRWPGAGYEDWGKVLDELKERGYDAVRIDAYPHLIASDPAREWELLPVWNQHDWGSPAPTRVRVQPALNEFIGLCAERGVKVALSSWFRQDENDVRMHIKSPEDLGQIWKRTLDTIAEAGLMDSILWVDLCNEWPVPLWAPFLKFASEGIDGVPSRTQPDIRKWMADAISIPRQAYPSLDYCFSYTGEYTNWREQDVSFMDLLEPHIWMAQEEVSDFEPRMGFDLGKAGFDPAMYDILARKAEPLYRENPDHWKSCLKGGIDLLAEWSRETGKPLITTEGWALVAYKDWPLLDWEWVKELCAFGVEEASKTGRWMALSTSHFCGPQFVGMWQDIEWHKRLTDLIHQGHIE